MPSLFRATRGPLEAAAFFTDTDDALSFLARRRGIAMNDRPPKPPPIAEAIHWVSRITSVALVMLLPILGGRWLDDRWKTQYWALIGLVVGLLVGLMQLLAIAKEAGKRNAGKRNGPARDASRTTPGSMTSSQPTSADAPRDANDSRP